MVRLALVLTDLGVARILRKHPGSLSIFYGCKPNWHGTG